MADKGNDNVVTKALTTTMKMANKGKNEDGGQAVTTMDGD